MAEAGSGMSIIDVGMPSGFTLDQQHLQQVYSHTESSMIIAFCYILSVYWLLAVIYYITIIRYKHGTKI